MGNRPVPGRSVRGPVVTVRHVMRAVHAPGRAGLALGSRCARAWPRRARAGLLRLRRGAPVCPRDKGSLAEGSPEPHLEGRGKGCERLIKPRSTLRLAANDAAAQGGLLRVQRVMSRPCLSFPRACRKQRATIGAEEKRGVSTLEPRLSECGPRLGVVVGEGHARAPAFTKGRAL